ncbi:alpha-amylase family glycosyl hydrolase [Enterocloster sp. OA13]|uniref:alpha-amylase family glycosyl hydrolase n=1 Tax=Enterocloster TaxID=2719313 RepID=UPI000472F253|nr:alpha-amylase family glycosyl hydrolase [Lachnoclostridium pacaense]MCC2820308.1 alpha-amylase [Lachnoclostridium pacaense]MCH1952133.1 alpha-amylase family glycosyl hydrolase [Enterocloster sp. OA13]
MSTWYERGVFYHMYPLGMTGAPKHNDATEVTNRFEELSQWIPHIRSLGCNAVYIGPLFESTSHGYDTRDYKLVDRRLGDNGAFKDFVEQCHDSGIRVVVDGVFNHTGREFFAFKDIQEKKWDSPYRDWYKGVNFDWQSPCGDPFGYDAWQGHFELPCLNLFNPAVRAYLFDVIRFWVDEFDIDGIRLDCANVLDFNFMKEMRQETAQMKEDFWLMGEVIHGDYSRWVNPEMLHSVTNYELHKSLYSGFNDHNFFEIAHNVRRLEAIGRQLYTFVDNHDEDRIASKLKLKEHLIPIYLCLFTLPGIPSIYYGGEWGVEGKRTNTSDEALRPAIAISQSDGLKCELTEFISAIGRIHDENEALHGGRYQELLLTNRQYAFARHGEDSVIITAVNNDDNEVEIDVPVPVPAREAVSLLEDGSGEAVLPVSDGKVHIKLRGNRGAVLKLKGEN